MYKLQNVIFLAFVLVAFIAVFKYIFEVHISFESLSPFYVDAIDYIANLNIFFLFLCNNFPTNSIHNFPLCWWFESLTKNIPLLLLLFFPSCRKPQCKYFSSLKKYHSTIKFCLEMVVTCLFLNSFYYV